MNNVIDCNVTSRYHNGMFVKLFSQILDSSIADNRKLRHFFTDLLLCADASGNVMMTETAIARRIGATVEEVEWGLKELSSPDPRSKTPDYEGRRIERLDGHGYGWKILNYEMYRAMRDAEQLREATRLRVQRHRAKKSSCNTGNAPCNASNAMQKEEEEGEEEAKAEVPPKVKKSKVDIPIFDESDSEDFRAIMTDWFNYKTQRKERYVETGWKRILAEQRQYPLAKVAASVDKSIRQMWKGLFTDKITEEESVRFLKVENKPSSEEPDIDLFATMLAKRAELQAKEDAENQPPEPMEDVEWS